MPTETGKINYEKEVRHFIQKGRIGIKDIGFGFSLFEEQEEEEYDIFKRFMHNNKEVVIHISVKKEIEKTENPLYFQEQKKLYFQEFPGNKVNSKLEALESENKDLKRLLCEKHQIIDQFIIFGLILIFLSISLVLSQFTQLVLIHNTLAKIGMLISLTTLIVLGFKYKYECRKNGNI